jgi:hypothetical protein
LLFFLSFSSHDLTFNVDFFKRKLGFVIFFILLFVVLSGSHNLTKMLSGLAQATRAVTLEG